MSETQKHGNWKKYPQNIPDKLGAPYLVWVKGKNKFIEVNNTIYVATWEGIDRLGVNCPWTFELPSDVYHPQSSFPGMQILAFRDMEDLYEEAWNGTRKEHEEKEKKGERIFQ